MGLALALMVPTVVMGGAIDSAGAVTGPAIYRVNAGGPNIDVSPDPDWVRVGRSAAGIQTAPGITFSNTAGNTDVTTTDVINTSNVDPAIPMAVFQTLARTSATAGNQMNWGFDVPNGEYEVRLHTTEHQSSTINAIGGRVFDVSLEGAVALDNYDILAETGGVKSLAVTETLTTQVNDGVLNLDFTAVVSVAIIRGIEILPILPEGNVAPTISASPNPAEAVIDETTVVDIATFDANADPVTTSITSGPGFAALVGGDLELTPDAGDLAGSPYTVTVEASDGELTSEVDVTVNVVEPSPVIYRVNTGGATLAATDNGPDFLGITAAGTSVPGLTLGGDVTGPTTNTNTFAPLPTGVPNALYQSTLHTPTGGAAGTGQLNFDFTVPSSGDYEVTLFFAENAAAITGPDQREFDVALEGVTVLDNHDIWETVGALNIPDTQTFETTVTDGVLDFDLIAQINIAGIRGIQISTTEEPPPNEPPTITADPEEISVEAGQTGVVDLTTNDLDGDPLTTVITSGPSFATLVGGDLELAPTLGDVAGSPYTVTVQVDDGEDTDSVDVTVTVTAPPNQAPTITADPEEISVEAGQTGVVDLTTNDLDGDPLTTSITSGPSFATLVGGDLEIAPTLGDVAGSPYTVTVQVDDGEDTDSVDVTVTVTAPVDPPEGGTFGDFDGDGDTDRAVFRPTGGNWYIDGGGPSVQWGLNGDKPVAADYDGDGDTEIAVFRPSSGRWYINGVAGSTQWGLNGDIPVPGDYDGDGDADIAVFRPSNGRWYINGGGPSTQWGANGDIPVPGDYDGDGDAGIAVFRPSNGRWYIEGGGPSTQFGASGDQPVAADWDNDGDTDIAVFRTSNGRWYVNGVAGNVPWGINGDIAVPGDYDGDGAIDRAVWRPASGRWYVEGIAGNVQWGTNGDIPSPRPIGTP